MVACGIIRDIATAGMFKTVRSNARVSSSGRGTTVDTSRHTAIHRMLSAWSVAGELEHSATVGQVCCGSLYGKGSTKVVRQTIFLLLFALTLRGPSGGHCVELKGGADVDEARRTLGALRAPSVSNFPLPQSPTQWPPEGPRRVSAKEAGGL
jgi:hypothetical protein